MNPTTEEIKSKLNAVDFIGEYLRLEKAGTNWKACCPFHNEKSPSFMVSEEKQIWHCFGCGKGGDIFGFLMEMEGLEFKEAIKILADKAGVELPNYNPKATVAKSNTLEILELATKFYEKQLWNGAGKSRALEYLRKRGIKDEATKEFRLGYAPAGWRNILNFLLERGYTIGDIEKTGLLVKKEKNKGQQTASGSFSGSSHGPSDNFYDRFRDRLIFPISDVSGRVVGYSARVSPGGDESQAKYVNTPETGVYHKSSALYGIDKAKMHIRAKDQAILVEGNMDVVASYQSGFENTVAVSGTALTPQQLDIIKRYTQNIYMFFDMDDAGRQAARRSAELAFGKNMNVFIVSVENGKDAADVVRENPKDLTKAIQNSIPAMQYFLREIVSQNNKKDAQGKKKIADEVLELISNFSDEIERHHWIRKLAEELDIDEKLLADRVIREKRQYPEKRVTEEVSNQLSAKRSDMLKKNLLGVIIADQIMWKNAVGDFREDLILVFGENSFYWKVISKGEEMGFDFEKVLTNIGEDKENKLRKLQFESKYSFDEGNGASEVPHEEIQEFFRGYLRELKEEIKKEIMKRLEDKIKEAEQKGNKKLVQDLAQEFQKISGQEKE